MNKNKIRTCGNCIHLDKKRYIYNNHKSYICNCKDCEDCRFISYYKPSRPTNCKYHKFRNENHETKHISKSTKQIIDFLYGEEIDNKLLTFLEKKK